MFISNSFIIFILFHNLITSIFFLVPLLVLLPVLSNGANSEYSACSIPYSCGRIQNIGYPFWGGNRPEYCGTSNFKLNCLAGAEYPTMSVYNNGSIGLNVEKINTSSHTIYIAREKMLHNCYAYDTSNITLLPSLKENYPSKDRITLRYGCNNCSNIVGNSSKSFKCANTDNTIGDVYYFNGDTNYSSCSCVNHVSVPMEEGLMQELRNNESLSLWSALTQLPVEMVYAADFEKCSKCEESGGKCGSSSDNKFMCYCKNGAQPLKCSPSSGGRRKLAIILGSGVAAGITVLVALVISFYKMYMDDQFTLIWSKTSDDQNVATFLQSYGSLAPKRYTYADIRKMTNSFKDKLGEGGYGTVYKGKLQDGRLVAVKNLKMLKGDDGKDFINEVLSISRTNHINVVTLLGFCFQGKKRALVFEFLPNGSLEKFINGRDSSRSLDCETMFNIAIGIAKGLDYLHRGCNIQILHFDIKPHNILLDEEFHPKISDFGTARLYPPKYSTISMSVARGTIGYIAPEIVSRNFGSISHKSDVYSYGMILLDLVFGRKNMIFDDQGCETHFFPEFVYNRLEEEVATHGNDCDFKQKLVRKMIMVGLWCTQTYSSNRPPMNKVLEMLEGSLELIPMPPKPQLSSPPARSLYDTSLTMSTT
ncbi:LEAF RUST 10 DISEASE-RESISTANCE LOCUS RECEPTOR-LIKE PROTEIN KINASE-like 2.1 [Bienertia sinuspersici]